MRASPSGVRFADLVKVYQVRQVLKAIERLKEEGVV